MPGRWYNTQQVSANGRVEWPSGPIDFPLPAGFIPTWLDAWVIQGGPPDPAEVFVAGPSQSTTQSNLWSPFVLPAGGNPGEWKATQPGWRQGQFTANTAANPSPPNPPQFAIGIALMALRNNAGTAYQYELWVDIVHLKS